MDTSTIRIYDKFEFWSAAYCSCEHCLHNPGKDKPCPHEVYCIADIKQEAERREQFGSITMPNGVKLSAGS